jgi:RNA polymerase sigma-70 factor (ECF subfamily)
MMNENELITKAQGGDVKAFEDLVRLYQDKIFNIVVYRVKDRALAEDITQEIFIRVFKNINKFSFKSNFYTWLYTVANNVIKDSYKKYRSITESLPAEFVPETSIEISEEIKREEIKRVVQEAIFQLSADFQLVLILADMEGLDYKEISQIIKAPTGTVKSRLHRAREMLKDYILKKHGNILAKDIV